MPEQDSESPKVVSSQIEDHGDIHSWKAAFSKGGEIALEIFDNLDEIGEAIDPAQERKLIRKVDLILVPFFAVSYIFFL